MAKRSMLDNIYIYIVPKVTALGAAVVILGALFKIMHWAGAATMLIVGMGTEAVLFAIGVFEPAHPDAPRPDWTRVYPQLADSYSGELPKEAVILGGSKPAQSGPKQDPKVLEKIAALDKALAGAVSPDQVKNLGKGMEDLTNNVSKMTKLADASVATGEYAKNVKLASNAIQEMNKSYKATLDSMSGMANASKDAKAYHAQVQTLTKNLTELNAVYEVELRSTNKHVKAVNDFYSNLAVAMQNVQNASKDTEKFKNEMSSLATNLTSMNKIYGGMLNAMKA